MIDRFVPRVIATPDVSIEVEGAARPELNDSLITLLVEESVGPHRCEARFNNWGSTSGDAGYLYFDRTVLDFGKELVVRINSKKEIFRGFISTIEGQFGGDEPPSVIIRAEDGLAALRAPRRTRTFVDMSDAEVFDQIASDNRLYAATEAQGVTHKVLIQLNQSDLAFIMERASLMGVEVWLQGDVLHVMSRSARTAAADEVHLALGRGLQAFNVAADVSNQFTKATVSGWDVTRKEQLLCDASDNIISSELAGGQSSATIIQSIYGERVDRIVQQQPLSDADAQHIAESAFSQQARRFVTGRGIANGDPRICVGTRLTLSGVGDLFSGTYTVTEVQHRYQREGDSGYTTSFVVERPSIGST